MVSQQHGLGARLVAAAGREQAVAAGATRLLERSGCRSDEPATDAHLAYGKRRLLEIAIALACEPRVLLLDEPVAGVPAGEREELFRRGALPADVSVLLIEHDMDLVFNFAKRVTVLVNGAVLAEGDVQSDRQRSAGQGRLPGRRGMAAMGRG